MWAPPELRPRLGVVPVGTVNVYARELRLPLNPEAAWQVVTKGSSRRVDAGLVRSADGRRRYFAQLAGAGFDAMAIAALDLNLKRRVMWLAYVISGIELLTRRLPLLTVRADNTTVAGRFVFIGKGSYYGGPFELFPDARLDDGQLTVCVFQGQRLWDVLRYMQGVFRGVHASYADVCCLKTRRVQVESGEPAPLELDGELWGDCPAEFSVEPGALRVLAP
jgi:diacylglycerol kinase family enzyme